MCVVQLGIGKRLSPAGLNSTLLVAVTIGCRFGCLYWLPLIQTGYTVNLPNHLHVTVLSEQLTAESSTWEAYLNPHTVQIQTYVIPTYTTV